MAGLTYILIGSIIGTVRPKACGSRFLAVMKEVRCKTPRDQELHIILDNLSAHKTPEFQNGRGETGCSLSLHAQEFLLAECIGGLVLTTGAAILMPRGIH